MNRDNNLLREAEAWVRENEPNELAEVIAAIAVVVGLVLIFGVLHLSI